MTKQTENKIPKLHDKYRGTGILAKITYMGRKIPIMSYSYPEKEKHVWYIQGTNPHLDDKMLFSYTPKQLEIIRKAIDRLKHSRIVVKGYIVLVDTISTELLTDVVDNMLLGNKKSKIPNVCRHWWLERISPNLFCIGCRTFTRVEMFDLVERIIDRKIALEKHDKKMKGAN